MSQDKPLITNDNWMLQALKGSRSYLGRNQHSEQKEELYHPTSSTSSTLCKLQIIIKQHVHNHIK